MPRKKLHSIAAAIVILAGSTIIGLGLAEGILRIKNSDMRNYDIEMWKYARDLKEPSEDPKMAFDHRPSAEATLQAVKIRTNEWRLRGGPVPSTPSGIRRILFLGSSITLGWGVPEEATLPSQVQQLFKKDGKDVVVMNGGVGNYDAERYVERFFTELIGLKPTDIVVQYFLRDAENLEAGPTSFVMRNSQLAVSLWIASSRFFGATGEQNLLKHYQAVYQQDAPGFLKMKASLARLAKYARDNNIRLYLAMTPDIHNLHPYDFKFIHDIMRGIAAEDGFTYVDFLPALESVEHAQDLWAMPGDPHPNAMGHKLMAETLFPVLSNAR